MCRYACDLQPMLKVLAGSDNIERLLHIDVPVSYSIVLVRLRTYRMADRAIVIFSCLFQVNLSKLRYFYIDEMDAYYINKVDRDQKRAHRRVSHFFLSNRNVFISHLDC